MSVPEIISLLKELLPKEADSALLEDIALQSSYIVFDHAGETLFRAGDAAKGFYWVLSGAVEQRFGTSLSLQFEKGYMVGLEEFLQQRFISTHWVSLEPTATIFIDQRCFEHFLVLDREMLLTHTQLAQQLIQLKENLKRALGTSLQQIA